MTPFLLFFSCSEPVEIRTLSYSALEANEVVSIEALSVPYTDAVQGTFRALNSYGAALATSDPISFFVDGSDEASTVFTAAFGYARPSLNDGDGFRLSPEDDFIFPIMQSENKALQLPQLTPLLGHPEMVE